MAFLDLASLGWEIAGAMGVYTIARNYLQDNKAVREKKEKAFTDAVSRILVCENRLDHADREIGALAEIVKKYADLNVLVAGLSSSVKSLESGLQEVKLTYRELNRDITKFFQDHSNAS